MVSQALLPLGYRIGQCGVPSAGVSGSGVGLPFGGRRGFLGVGVPSILGSHVRRTRMFGKYRKETYGK